MTITIKPHMAGGVLVTVERDGQVVFRDRAHDEAKGLRMAWRRIAPARPRRRSGGADDARAGE